MDNLATELLHEVKQSAKRWFIAFLVMVVLEIITVAGFLWYITLPVEEYNYEQEIENIDNSDIRQIIGGDYGSETESNLQTQSGEKA
jgi:hypothetical protein